MIESYAVIVELQEDQLNFFELTLTSIISELNEVNLISKKSFRFIICAKEERLDLQFVNELLEKHELPIDYDIIGNDKYSLIFLHELGMNYSGVIYLHCNLVYRPGFLSQIIVSIENCNEIMFVPVVDLKLAGDDWNSKKRELIDFFNNEGNCVDHFFWTDVGFGIHCNDFISWRTVDCRPLLVCRGSLEKFIEEKISLKELCSLDFLNTGKVSVISDTITFVRNSYNDLDSSIYTTDSNSFDDFFILLSSRLRRNPENSLQYISNVNLIGNPKKTPMSYSSEILLQEGVLSQLLIKFSFYNTLSSLGVQYSLNKISQTPISLPLRLKGQGNIALYQKSQMDQIYRILGTGNERMVYKQIRKRISELLTYLRKEHSFRRIFIYGAGLHSETLLKIWRQKRAPKISAVCVSQKNGEQKYCENLQIMSIDDIHCSADDLIITSSMSFEIDMVQKTKECYPNTSIYTIWNTYLTFFNR